MWFAFGFITIIAFSIYVGIKRHQASWVGNVNRVEGVPYTYQIQRIKGKPIWLNIGLLSRAGFGEICFSLKRESVFDRIFKYVGLSQEHQTGDKGFDDLVYIVSDDAAVHETLKVNKSLMDSAVWALSLGSRNRCKPQEIHVRNARIWIRCKLDRHFKDEDARRLATEIVPLLESIREAISQSGFPANKRGLRDPFVIKAAVILAISSGMVVNVMIQGVRIAVTKVPFTIDLPSLWHDALWWGGGVLGVLIVATITLLGRSARAHLVLIELLLVGSFGAITSAAAELRDANMEFDSSEVHEYRAKVLNKKISRSRRSTSYHVYLSDWNGEKREIKVSVSSAIYRSVQTGDAMVVLQRDGYLGYRWVQRIYRSPDGPWVDDWDAESGMRFRK